MLRNLLFFSAIFFIAGQLPNLASAQTTSSDSANANAAVRDAEKNAPPSPEAIEPIDQLNEQAQNNPQTQTEATKKAVAEDPFASDDFALPEGLQAHTEPPPPVADPLEKFNHDSTRLNDKFDKYIGKPVAEFYNDVMPKPLNRMVNNFFRNFDSLTTVANDVFQGNFYQASSDTWRFTINTTIGIAGLFDPATDMGLDYNNETLGLTFAQWGWTDSSYLVVPFLGPKTVRGFIGDYIDFEYISFYAFLRPWQLQWGVLLAYLLNKRVQLLQYQSVMDNAAINPYVFTRNAYLQREAYLIKRNKELDNPNTVAQTRAFNNPYYLYE